MTFTTSPTYEPGSCSICSSSLSILTDSQQPFQVNPSWECRMKTKTNHKPWIKPTISCCWKMAANYVSPIWTQNSGLWGIVYDYTSPIMESLKEGYIPYSWEGPADDVIFFFVPFPKAWIRASPRVTTFASGGRHLGLRLLQNFKEEKNKGEIFYEVKGPRRDGYVEGRTFGIQVISLCFKAMEVMSLDTQLKQRVMDMRHVVMTKTVPGLHRSAWHLLGSPHRCYNSCNSLSLTVSFSVSRLLAELCLATEDCNKELCKP